ncbi:hypothetical protein [Pseudomonas atacamensis]|uniref:hypothetical protein n=1 Tax=Pseudomonas atacamensis TaxID=2565368 RepID=UPI0019CFA98F|nr:hypothetical protein [Pseudomonas atacamensis]QSL90513.1 hypothetical protein JWU58_27120 [Pseudomonas atacamensis]
MQLKCSRKREIQMIDHEAFAVIRADSKYVMGIMPNGDEWFLPHRSSVKAIAAAAPELMQASHSVLVAREHVVGVSGNSKHRLLHTTVGEYRISRLIPHQPFVAAAAVNASAAYWPNCQRIKSSQRDAATAL